MVSITANATTLKIGEVTQVSGVVRDVNGTPIAGVPITWSTSPTTIATIASTSASAGLLSAKGVGTATIYANADTVVRSITVTVIDSASTSTPAPSVPTGASGGSYGSATAAELPRATVNTAYPAVARQIRVPAGANLQDAIDAAQAGDELLLAPGAVYSGNFYLRNKGVLSGWITIRTDISDASIGAPGTRMTPSRAASANLAKIVTPNIYSVITTDLGANHYRFTGVEFAVASSVTDMNALVRLGESQNTQNSAATTAGYLIFDRTYIHGNPSGQLKRCVMLNSAMTAIVDSWLGDCHSNVSDSQAIVGWNGPGPFLIQNNHLEGGHEVIMFGGGSGTVPNVSPVRHHHPRQPHHAAVGVEGRVAGEEPDRVQACAPHAHRGQRHREHVGRRPGRLRLRHEVGEPELGHAVDPDHGHHDPPQQDPERRQRVQFRGQSVRGSGRSRGSNRHHRQHRGERRRGDVRR